MQGSLQIGIFPLPLIGDVEGGHRVTAGDDVDVLKPGASNEVCDVRIASRMKKHFHSRNRRFLRKQISGEIALGIKVDAEALKAAFFAHSGKQPGSVRLADTALQIQDRDDFGATMCSRLHTASVARLNGGVEQRDIESDSLWRSEALFGGSPFLPGADLRYNLAMTAKLTKELAAALHATGDRELEVVDPETSRVYFIVDSEMHRQAMDALRRQQDRDAISQGIVEMEAGQGTPLDEAFDDIRLSLKLRQRQS